MRVIHPSAPGPPFLRTAARALRLALRRRCPACTRGRIWSSWFHLAPRCPSCGFVPNRGEADYFIGAYLVNFIVAELIPVGVFVIALIATWPSPPWDLLLWATMALAVIAPIATYPFTMTFWLAADLIFRPVGSER